MLKLYLRAVVMLASLFLMLLVGASAIAPIDKQIDSFMITMENCAGACMLGIQPGKTTVGATMTYLRSHLWVGDVHLNAPGNGYAQITWDWSGQHPDSVDDSKQGRITFYWEEENESEPTLVDSVIETISVYTHIRLYSFQEWLGDTRIGYVNKREDGTLGYTVVYNVSGGLISVVAEMRCPVSMVSYWNARARMTISIGRNKSPYVRPSEMVQMC